MDQTEQRKSGSVEDMRKEFSANVLPRIENAADFHFRLCGDHEKRTDKTGGYSPNFQSGFYKEAKRLITLIEDIIKLSKLDEGP